MLHWNGVGWTCTFTIITSSLKREFSLLEWPLSSTDLTWNLDLHSLPPIERVFVQNQGFPPGGLALGNLQSFWSEIKINRTSCECGE